MKLREAINPMTWVNRAIDNRIAQHTKGATNGMKYNPLLSNIKVANDDKQFTRRLLENSVWYTGNEQDLAWFYKKEAPKFYRNGQESESLNYFWTNDETEARRIHSGIPQLISEKMVDLIVGNGFDINIEGENEEEIHAELTLLLADNKFRSLLAKSIETESWSGGVAWKLTWNPELTDFPIIEMWQPENYTNKVVSGRIVEDIFYIYYERDKTTYRLSEIYGVDRNKGAYIDYKLDMLATKRSGQNAESVFVPVPLTSIEETADLKRYDFNGYFRRLSAYKPNKLPNNEFRYSVLGESDYAGSYGPFDAIDEIISTWVQEHRDGKLFRYFPEELMLKDKDGGSNYPSQFKKQHYLLADSPSEDVEKSKIQFSQGDLRTEKHVESYKHFMTLILNNAGLSPLTIGATGLESIAASEQSQQEREKVSIRTRNKKIEVWTEFLEDILRTALDFHYMTKGIRMNDDNTYNVGAIPEYDLIVTFNDYIIKSKRDRTEEVQQGIGTGWDILSAVQYIHTDMTEREQLATSARIKLENNYPSISQAEASALQSENGDYLELMVEQGVEIIPVNEPNDGQPVPINVPPNTDGTTMAE